MRLKEYCEEYSINIRKLADKWGIAYRTLYYVIQGSECSYQNMEKIIKGSKGKVTFEDLKPIPKTDSVKKRKSDKKTDLLCEKYKEQTPHTG